MNETKTLECHHCDTFGESCCKSSQERQKTATVLAGIVQRQGAEMGKLRVQLESANATIKGLRDEIADHIKGVA